MFFFGFQFVIDSIFDAALPDWIASFYLLPERNTQKNIRDRRCAHA